VQTRRERCAQPGDGLVDIACELSKELALPAVMSSTGCGQEKVLDRIAVHNGGELSTRVLDVRRYM
jgi:hypothetical protein